jgi:RND family efflux transporter MFP subunit
MKSGRDALNGFTVYCQGLCPFPSAGGATMKKVLIAISILVLLTLSYLAGRHNEFKNSRSAADPHRVLYYVDPMHPSYKSDKPGIAPDCGMQLQPVYADEANRTGSDAGEHGSIPSGVVKISLEQQQLIGIRLVEVSKTAGAYHVTAPGRVVADDTRTYRLTAGVEGVVLSTSDNSVGSSVKKDEVLAVFSSPEFLTAEATFLTNWNRAPENRYEYGSQKEWKDQTLMLAASRLRSLGMSERQLKELAETKRVTDSIDIAAPVNGIIVARNISAGQRVDKGAEFYRIADLSRVWILASLREDEADGLRPGMDVKISQPNGNRKWSARVSGAVPQFDPATRTLQVRLEADNPGLVLRPDMFVNVDLEVHAPDALSVPTEALLDSGITRIVYVDRGNGAFESRQVETGRRSSDRVEIISGLTPGEKVVVSGTFLLDSESRLRSPQHATSSSAARVIADSSATLPKSAKDLACGMEVNPADSVKAGNTESYDGTTYYFCSRTCREKFRKNPQALMSRADGHHDSADSGMTKPRGAARD